MVTVFSTGFTGSVGAFRLPQNFGSSTFAFVIAAPGIYSEFRKSQVVAMNGAGGVVQLSQTTGAAPALKPLKLTAQQWSRLMPQEPSKASLHLHQ